ncbi:MAG: patatin-like phospholipase family protein, partial [Micavibrio sp.]|nr:patatin-like phospholipase family protein [Micavibrio sp.]
MAEKAEFKNTPELTPVFTAMHFGAGAERGIMSMGVPIFQEMATGLPISALANHVSGISIGAATAAILTTPRYENSNVPRFTALDAEAGIKQIIRLAAPHRNAYMVRRALPNVLQFMHEAEKVSVDILAKKTDGGITLAKHAVARRYHEMMGSTSKYTYSENRPCQIVVKNVFKPVNRLIDSWLNTMMKNARYDIHIPHQAFNLAFRTEDTDRPLGLKDSITGLHVSAFNYTRDEPAHFSHYRDINGKSKDVSDPDMLLDDIAAGSCAAPAYFDYHIARNGEYYLDVGHLDNTAFNAINSVQSHVGDDIPIDCISIGTGIEERVLDGKKINNPLHLILDAGQRYFEKRDTKILSKNLHNGQLHHYDIPLSAAREKYADNPKLVRAASILGFDLLARDQDDEVSRVPSSTSFGNTSKEGLERLSEYKWDL